MSKFEHHIFICMNQREPGHPRRSCNSDGSGELHQIFNEGVSRRGLKGRVRANKAGCLDQCEHGPNVVVYPEAVWYGQVTPNDVDEILDSHILGGKPVERLKIADDCLNAGSCPHKPKR